MDATTQRPEEILEQVHQCFEEYPPNLDEASSILEKAVSQFPENIEILETYGEVLCEMCDERAPEVMLRLIKLSPDDGASKYLYMAQISSGCDAVTYARKGIELMKGEPATEPEALSRACCIIAEAYMTDLCDEEDAQSQCESSLKAALEAAETFEAHASMAMFQKIIGDMDCANKHCNACVEMCKAEDSSDEEAEMPDYDARLAFARTLVDMDRASEAVEIVLEPLLQENEEDVNLWYLLGYANVVAKDACAALECWEHAKRVSRVEGSKDMWKEPLSELRQRIEKVAESEGDGGMDDEEEETEMED